jgi:large subunit ribosomal protein L21
MQAVLLTVTDRTAMTYAIIRAAGMQFRAEPGKTIRMPTLDAEEGSTVTFDQVLLGSDGTNVRAGAPLVEGAKVTGEVVRHGRGDKIIVFKFKRRKNYARKQGHRQGFTEVRINDITLG